MSGNYYVMQAKTKLCNYSKIVKEIEFTLKRIQNLEYQLKKPATSQITGMPKSSTIIFDKIEYLVNKKIELETYLKKKIKKENTERTEIARAVSMLECPDEAAVLRFKYIDGQKWSEVVNSLFSAFDDFEEKRDAYERRTYRLHGRALNNLGKIGVKVWQSK